MAKKGFKAACTHCLIVAASPTIISGLGAGLLSGWQPESIKLGATIGLASGWALILAEELGYKLPYTRCQNRPNSNNHQFASMSPWHISADNPGIKTSVMRWKDKPLLPDEFVFIGCDPPIYETDMLRFLQIALKRQRQVSDRESNTRKANGNKMKSNEVLSERHYTYVINPRFESGEYQSIKTILQLTGLWLNHRNGNPGKLYSPNGDLFAERLLRVARWRWLTILEQQGSKKKRTFSLRVPSPKFMTKKKYN